MTTNVEDGSCAQHGFGEQGGGELACRDDDNAACVPGGGFSTISFPATGNHLFWVMVDGGGGSPSVGPYELDLNFQ
ncbi:MAG TPA: hypothetical protein VLT45_30760 [Kofleriaceae bacterium]|nr:hypothetical protein [Kofleriaceae bacterium]